MSLSLDITDEVEDEWDSWGGEIWLKTNFHESTATNVLAMDHGTGQWRWIMAMDHDISKNLSYDKNAIFTSG